MCLDAMIESMQLINVVDSGGNGGFKYGAYEPVQGWILLLKL